MLRFLTPLTLLLLVYLLPTKGYAQNAGTYMSGIGVEFKGINNDMWDYISAVSHDRKARKIESRRKELIQSLNSARTKVARMPAFESDGSYRDSVVAFLNICYYVISQDYEKLVNMEEIAEQSYDKMEAYMLAQQQANDRLDVANDALDREEHAFAARHNVNLVKTADAVNTKLEKAGAVFAYYNRYYLVFFKCSKQENYLVEAMNRNDMNALEQNKNALATYAAEGLAKLDTMPSYKEDNSLRLVCKELLSFYKDEANEKVPVITDFYLKKENFEKIKTAFDNKAQSKRTQDDVNQYNTAVNDYNKALNTFNPINEELNKKRSMLIDKWNKSTKTFLDKHVPKKK